MQKVSELSSSIVVTKRKEVTCPFPMQCSVPGDCRRMVRKKCAFGPSRISLGLARDPFGVAGTCRDLGVRTM